MLDKRITQTEFGALVGVSRQAIGDLVKRGVLDMSEPASKCLVKYCAHLREVAAGRSSGDDDLDLVTERARLASEQADKIAMQNAVTRQELAPVHVVEDVLAKAGAKVAGILDTIPGIIQRRVPSLRATDIDLIRREIAKARNVAAAVNIGDLGVSAFTVPDEAPIDV